MFASFTPRKNLARPVKWTDERSTSFLSDNHGRAQDIHGELALAADGAFLGVRVRGYGNLGAYVAGVAPLPLSLNIAKNIASVYRTPLIEVDIKCVVTNTDTDGRISRCRPSRSQLLHGAADRSRRRRDGH